MEATSRMQRHSDVFQSFLRGFFSFFLFRFFLVVFFRVFFQEFLFFLDLFRAFFPPSFQGFKFSEIFGEVFLERGTEVDRDFVEIVFFLEIVDAETLVSPCCEGSGVKSFRHG